VLSVAEVSRGFLQPEHATLLAPYAEQYFQVLPRIWASRSEHIRVQLSQVLFPHPAASPELLARIDAFLATEEPDPGLARVLAEKRDVVSRALRSRALPAVPG
jgi:aminopeptidase N